MENKYVLRPLFNRFQKELVSYCNTQTGKDFISSFGGNELKENYPVVKVTPDSVHQQLDKKTYRAVFYSRSPYVTKFAEVLTCCEIAEANKYRVDGNLSEFVIPHYMGETSRLKGVLPTIYMDSGTFYPDANPESTSVDGYVLRGGVNEGFTTIRAGAGTASLDSGATSDTPLLQASGTTNQYANLRRGFYLFDTSSIGAGIVSTGVLSYYFTSKGDDLGTVGQAAIVSSNPSSNTALATGDFGSVGTTQFATNKTYASISTGTYTDFTLNASGVAAIVSGISKFGLRDENDRSGTGPTWVSSQYQYLTTTNADAGSNKPKLVVTYTLPFSGGVIII